MIKDKPKMKLTFIPATFFGSLLLLGGCSTEGARLSGPERVEMVDQIVTTDPIVTGEIPSANTGGIRP